MWDLVLVLVEMHNPDQDRHKAPTSTQPCPLSLRTWPIRPADEIYKRFAPKTRQRASGEQRWVWLETIGDWYLSDNSITELEVL